MLQIVLLVDFANIVWKMKFLNTKLSRVRTEKVPLKPNLN